MGNFCQLSEELKNDDKNEVNLSYGCCPILCGKICKHNIYQSQAQISFENFNGDKEENINNNRNERMYNDDNINLDERKYGFIYYKENSNKNKNEKNNDNKENNVIEKNSNDIGEKLNELLENTLEKNDLKVIHTGDKQYDTIITLSSISYTDSDFNFYLSNNFENEIISLGINIGSLKTVYSIFSKINNKYVTNVLLMNNSSRIIPSIICYSKTHRLFGDNSISSLSQNLDSSYNNLSRLIGFDNKIKIYNDEIIYAFDKKENNNEYKFNIKDENGLKEINVEYIIADFLILINNYYFKLEKIIYSSTYISVPDYYTSYQKDLIKLICQSLNMKDVNVFNESSAITMYYGYTKYRDNFVFQKNKVDSTIIKNILFIDSGHSKTSFILSKFKYNEFKVLYVSTLTNIGGRNFDELILKYCIDEFISNNNININEFNLSSKYSKMKYRLIEVIRKARTQLTVNSETSIKVDSFYNDIDLEIILTKEKFEELIKDYINEINKYLNDVISYANKNNIIIDCVEIAGELMRTPILQKIIEDKKIRICKSLLIDECISVGSSILGNYIKGKLPIANFKRFIHYCYYRIIYIIKNGNYKSKNKTLIDIGFINENEKEIKIKKSYLNENKLINIQFFYDKDNNNDVDKCLNNLLLIEYEINLEKIFEDNKVIIEKNDIILKVKIDEAQKITEPQIILNNNILDAEINMIKGGIYKTEIKENLLKKNIYKILKAHKNYDANYYIFIEKKNKISKYIYEIKGKINNKEEFKEQFQKMIKLDKKCHSNKQINKDSELVKEIENDLKTISLEIIDIMLKGNYDNQNVQILQQMKNNLIQDPSHFNFADFINFL